MMEQNTSRAEAERLQAIASKLLQSQDFSGAREFAILAQETEPLLDGSDEILAVADVLLAAEKRIGDCHRDWYAVLQLERRSDDFELIRKQYRRLALLLHPAKNKFALADDAFKHVSDAWAIMSDPGKKSLYDSEISVYQKSDLLAMRNEGNFRLHDHDQCTDLQEQQHQKLPVRRGDEPRQSSFWTACPYCYNLYEYARVYEDCCLVCQNCQKAFHGVIMPSLPPFVPGKEAYYCTWHLFPLQPPISCSEAENKGYVTNITPSASNWRPSSSPAVMPSQENGIGGAAGFMNGPVTQAYGTPSWPAKKRGRPRKYPLL